MKSISVIDPQGNSYEPTYPKRAKGLVKKGRARFVDACTICLTCPSCTEQEVTPMTSQQKPLTAAEIFTELKQIRAESSHINLAMEKLEKIPAGSDADTDICKEKTAAILQIAVSRETTNQALIRLYEKMYNDVSYDSHEEESEVNL